MADYKELLRRAVEALPENNGAARRAVYEKARAALVGQLRAINPPLPARDITTHRLQLEDCIRQVEQEASEANLAGMASAEPSGPLSLPPVLAAEAKLEGRGRPAPKQLTDSGRTRALPEPARAKALPEPVKAKVPPADAPAKLRPEPVKAKVEPPQQPRGKGNANSIEDIIVAAERDRGGVQLPVPGRAPEVKARPPKSQPVLVAQSDPPRDKDRPAPKPENRPLPAIVARAEAAKGRPAAGGFSVASDSPRRTIEPRRDSRSNAVAARAMEPLAFELPEDIAAMSAVREVEVEAQPVDPQGAIDRAIATLDREARGDAEPAHYADSEVEIDEAAVPAPVAKKNGLANGRNAEAANARGDVSRPRPAKEFATPRRPPRAETAVPRARSERGGLGAVTIFLIIFAVLLVGAGGAGFWAWQEGYINLDAMFGKGQQTVVAAATPATVTPDSTGPGNTATPAATAEPSTALKAEQRLPTADTSAPAQVAAATPSVDDSVAPLALQSPAPEAKTEERLGQDSSGTPSTAEEAAAALDPANAAGSQSLLLEASDNGTTGAVPYSGTVDWSKGVDENGLPTLVGKANIPARNLSVDLLIRKNSDPSLPASHLMEINFTVADSFIGGSIAGLPGVLLKNEELVQGAPLVGASARVVGNSFLFALSAAPEDSAANSKLLTSRKWMDLALIYASGKRAIITLEKDDKAQALFNDVFAAWSKTATN